MSPRICLIALIGMPASGKSSLSQFLLNNNKTQNSFSILHVCYDKFFNKLTDQLDFEQKYKEERQQILVLLHDISQCILNAESLDNFYDFLTINKLDNSEDYLVICDDNNYYRSMRYKLYQFCKSHSFGFGQIYIKSSLSASLSRNALRTDEQKIPDSVIRRMYERFEEPNPLEYYWESKTLNLESDVDLKEAQTLLFDFLKNAFENVPESTPIIATPEHIANLKHDLDLVLRQRINGIMILSRAMDPQEKLQRAQVLNEKRKRILKDFHENGNTNDAVFDFYIKMFEEE